MGETERFDQLFCAKACRVFMHMDMNVSLCLSLTPIGYPYWPGLIMDPRKLPPSMQLAANKGIGSKFWLYFYGTHDL